MKPLFASLLLLLVLSIPGSAPAASGFDFSAGHMLTSAGAPTLVGTKIPERY